MAGAMPDFSRMLYIGTARVAVHVAAICCWLVVAGGSYGKPPCVEGEARGNLLGRVVCTTRCEDDEDCPTEVPAGSFGKPRCLLKETARGSAAAGGREKKPRYCGLLCTADSYCPKGSRCTKLQYGDGAEDGDDDNPLAFVHEAMLKEDDLAGFCTWKAKNATKKKKAKAAPSLELSMRPLTYLTMARRGIQLPPGHREL